MTNNIDWQAMLIECLQQAIEALEDNGTHPLDVMLVRFRKVVQEALIDGQSSEPSATNKLIESVKGLENHTGFKAGMRGEREAVSDWVRKSDAINIIKAELPVHESAVDEGVLARKVADYLGECECNGSMYAPSALDILAIFRPYLRKRVHEALVDDAAAENAMQWFEKIAAEYVGFGASSAQMQPATLRAYLRQPVQCEASQSVSEEVVRHGERLSHYLEQFGGKDVNKRAEIYDLAWQAATAEMLDELLEAALEGV